MEFDTKKIKIIIITLTIIFGIYLIYRMIERKITLFENYNVKNLREKFTVNPFTIHNHLNENIILKINKFTKPISSKNSSTLTPQQVNDYLKNGNNIEVYLSSNMAKYCTYVIDMPYDQIRIKELHIGMVTDRSIVGSTDAFRSTVTNANAVRGQAFINIHNLSALPLDLQVGSITYNIKPYETYIYKGYLHMGVALGTIFKDVSAIPLYNDYVYLQPYSDVYYGLTSDTPQPKDSVGGGLQYSFYDKVQFGQTLWPFEAGIY